MTKRPILSVKNQQWIHGRGTIVYDPHRSNKTNTAWWAVMEVDREITRLFRWFIDRNLLNLTGVEGAGSLQPSGDAHVSIIRGAGDVRSVPDRVLKELWGKYHKQKVDFLYSPVVQSAKGEFFFVEVKCDFLVDIRRELGLPHDWKLHLTVGKMRDHWVGVRDNRLKSKWWNGRSDD